MKTFNAARTLARNAVFANARLNGRGEVEARLTELALSDRPYIREHVGAIRRARKATANRYPNVPRYGLGWSRGLAMQALRNAADLRRALAYLRAPQVILVVGDVPFAERIPTRTDNAQQQILEAAE